MLFGAVAGLLASVFAHQHSVPYSTPAYVNFFLSHAAAHAAGVLPFPRRTEYVGMMRPGFLSVAHDDTGFQPAGRPASAGAAVDRRSASAERVKRMVDMGVRGDGWRGLEGIGLRE